MQRLERNVFKISYLISLLIFHPNCAPLVTNCGWKENHKLSKTYAQYLILNIYQYTSKSGSKGLSRKKRDFKRALKIRMSLI